MKTTSIAVVAIIAATLSLGSLPALAQQNNSNKSFKSIPAAWEELTSSDFEIAVKQSEGVCIIPIGVIEKHGQHLPLGTDVFTSRESALRAAQKEYAVVYPFYFAGQIFEAMHQPGTIAYSPDMLYNLLDETCREISRNGIKKIILVNGHGGNTYFLQYFCQTQLAKERDYSLYLFTPAVDAETQKVISSMRKSKTGGHADEGESATMLAIRPELVKMERATAESGEDQKRLNLPNAYTAIWWYSKYPNHYAGEASGASAELGKIIMEQKINQLAEVIKTVKADKSTMSLQREFWQKTSK